MPGLRLLQAGDKTDAAPISGKVARLIAIAHALLGNLDPSDEKAFRLAHDTLGRAQLKDQNAPRREARDIEAMERATIGHLLGAG